MAVTKVAAFVRQPSTVLGLSALIGTLTAVLTAQLTWQSAVPAIAGALAAIALPDNNGAQAAIKNAAAAVVTAEGIVVNGAAKETVVVSTAKVGAIVAVLVAGTLLSLGACTVEPAMTARRADAGSIVAIPCNAAMSSGTSGVQSAETVFAATVAYSAAGAVL